MFEKPLPNGMHVMLRGIPCGTSDEAVSQFLANYGIEIPAERISIRDYPSHASCMIAIPESVAIVLLNWALGDEALFEGVSAPQFEACRSMRNTTREHRRGKRY